LNDSAEISCTDSYHTQTDIPRRVCQYPNEKQLKPIPKQAKLPDKYREIKQDLKNKGKKLFIQKIVADWCKYRGKILVTDDAEMGKQAFRFFAESLI
jgi:hypothetical protein